MRNHQITSPATDKYFKAIKQHWDVICHAYAKLLEVIANPSHPEHEEMLEWLGDEFDPTHFEVEEVNAILAPKRRRA